MTFFFHQLKNFIQNDPLSDWLTHVHLVFNCFEPDPQTTFQEEIDEKKLSYKKDFFGFLKQYKEHVFYKDLTSEQTTGLSGTVTAESREEMKGGAGKVLLYDVTTGKFMGYGTNEEISG